MDQINVKSKNENYTIQKLKCGMQHLCWMKNNGEVDCMDGSKSSLEGQLDNYMKRDVLDIYAGKFRTCVLKKG